MLLEILVVNLHGIQRSRNTEEIVERGLIKGFQLPLLCFSLPGLLRCDQQYFGKIGIKENLAEKLKQIGQIQIIPDCEEVLGTKIGRKFFRKVTVLAKKLQNYQ